MDDVEPADRLTQAWFDLGVELVAAQDRNDMKTAMAIFQNSRRRSTRSGQAGERRLHR
jgi:hypothetical protein